MALTTDTVSTKALVELFEKQFTEAMIEQAVALSKCCWGETCVCPPIVPPTRRARLRRWLKSRLWYRPWALVHRILPGECDCDCDEWH